MKTETITVKEAAGRILWSTIYQARGKKLLAKGHVISEEDARMLQTEGMNEIEVSAIEENEVGELEAALKVAAEIGCGSIEIREAPGGRANLFATGPSCVLVDNALLLEINSEAGLAIATVRNFSYATAGQRIATVKSTPFAIPKTLLDTVISIVAEKGPVLQSRPILKPSIAVLYTDSEKGERARQSFEPILSRRLERLEATVSFAFATVEEETAVAESLQLLVDRAPTAILIASTTAPAGPDDAVGRAMVRAGCQLERFLAPVEPGNLLLLAYKNSIPILSAPGCFRSTKLNVLDLLLPPMLAQYRVCGWEIACLGMGGLLA